MKSEMHKESELQATKVLYDEDKDRLSGGIKNKNFNSGLLEVAEKKMKYVMEQTQTCSSKRTQLDKDKKTVEDYTKHVSAKKGKP